MQIFKEIVYAIAKRSKCEKKQVGAIIVKDGRIISSGYNGTPKGYPNCNEIEKEDHRAWQLIFEYIRDERMSERWLHKRFRRIMRKAGKR